MLQKHLLRPQGLLLLTAKIDRFTGRLCAIVEKLNMLCRLLLIIASIAIHEHGLQKNADTALWGRGLSLNISILLLLVRFDLDLEQMLLQGGVVIWLLMFTIVVIGDLTWH
jgi:hypothetical protein